jgi:hypothetical protein
VEKMEDTSTAFVQCKDGVLTWYVGLLSSFHIYF